MPYILKGKTVYKRMPDGKLVSRGTSPTVEKAKKHLAVLRMIEAGRTVKRSGK